MGFYGHYSNTNAQFTFDKVYSNRKAMDDNSTTDGVFIGRFVLIDYDTSDLVYKILFQRQEDRNKQTYNLYSSDTFTNKYKVTYDDFLVGIEIVDGEEVSHELDISKTRAQIEHGDKTYFAKCTGQDEDGYALFINDVDNDYWDNLQTDAATYGNGRGYDSTVWQKTFVNGVEQYAMIAELNSVVPTFDVSPDAPSELPATPHFDARSTGTYYNLHLQPTWGFRIKNAEASSVTSDGKISPSDILVENGDKKYHGAIYFNKDGFNSQVKSKNTNYIDEIVIAPTGKSGNKYNSHDGTPATVAPDVQELKIILPSLGNALSDIWDLIYGESRNQEIGWGNTTGLRLANTEENGFSYSVSDVNTLAGCINTAHDLMGAIVVDGLPADVNNALPNRIYYDKETRAYYIKYLYYNYDNVLESLEGMSTPTLEDLKQYIPGEYFYIDGNNYYLENKASFSKGATYYPKEDIESLFTEKDLAKEDYAPGLFHIKDDQGNLICVVKETLEAEDLSKTFYKFPEDFIDQAQVTVSKDNGYLFYNPKPHQVVKVDGDGIEYLSGYFKYLGTNADGAKMYHPLTGAADDPVYEVNGRYYFATEYTVDTEIDILTGNTVKIYNFGENEEKLTPLFTENNGIVTTHIVDFNNGTYYYVDIPNPYEADIVNYIKLQNKDDADIENVTYYKFNIQGSWIMASLNKPFYTQNVYHFKDPSGSYLLSDNKRKEPDRIYYELTGVLEEEDNQIKFYEPNKYYYYENNNYILDINKDLTEGRDYYTRYFAYVKEDLNDIYSTGAEWNMNVVDIPEGVTLAERTEYYDWKELVGFSRDLNTINGLLIEINNIIKMEDYDTRDRDTVQGSINVLNDLIDKINDLIPGQFIIVDEYGRMTSASYSDDQWININVNPSHEGPNVSITHEYNPVASTTSTFDINNNGDTIDLYTPNIDATGHVVGGNVETVTLPYGYKTIKVTNSSEVAAPASAISSTGQIADNTQDILIFSATNKWVKLDNVTEDIIKVGHLLSPAVANTEYGLASNETIATLDVDNTFEVPNFTFDEAGHITNAETHTVQLPENFSKIQVNGNSDKVDNSTIGGTATIEADSLVDTLTLGTRNKWIKLHPNATNDSIEFEHYVNKVTPTTSTHDFNTSGNTIPVEIQGFDEAGHVISHDTKTYTLPNGFKTIHGTNSSGTAFDSQYNATDVVAANPIDDFTISGKNRWIKVTTNGDDTVYLEHAAPGSASATVGDDVVQTPQFGGSFRALQVGIDQAGHVSSLNAHTVKIPEPSLTPGSGDVVTGISLVSSTGAFTEIKNNVGKLTIKDYSQGTDQGSLVNTDTINQAFAKLQNQRIALSETVENNRSNLQSQITANANAISLLTDDADPADLDSVKDLIDWVGVHGADFIAYQQETANNFTNVNNAIGAETSRAELAEAGLSGQIDQTNAALEAEQSRAESKEQELDEKIGNLNSDLNDGLQAASDRASTIEGNLSTVANAHEELADSVGVIADSVEALDGRVQTTEEAGAAQAQEIAALKNQITALEVLVDELKPVFTITYQVEGIAPATFSPGVETLINNNAKWTHEFEVASGLTTIETLYEGKQGQWSFNGWNTSDVTVAENKFTMPKANVVFTGSWTFTEDPKYTISYEVDLTNAPTTYSELPEATSHYSGEIVILPEVLTTEESDGGVWTCDWTYNGNIVSEVTVDNNDIVIIGVWTFFPTETEGPETPIE